MLPFSTKGGHGQTMNKVMNVKAYDIHKFIYGLAMTMIQRRIASIKGVNVKTNQRFIFSQYFLKIRGRQTDIKNLIRLDGIENPGKKTFPIDPKKQIGL